MKKQSIESQKGEIEFRKQLVQHQVGNKHYFDDEFDKKDIEEILNDRMKKTYDQMMSLKKRDITISPYIEIGAERCQRSLVMENDLYAEGASIDISFNMLRSCIYYKEVFNKSKLPIRICCDANSLPFLSDSIPFVFCYETLHHFPDPTPIINEIYRVIIPGGHFLFAEEPYKKILHFNLYKGKKVYSKNNLKANKIKKILDYFLAEQNCNEIEYGIVENDKISIGVWKQALRMFEEKDIELHSLRLIKSNLLNRRNILFYFLAFLFGGEISGVCRKSGVFSEEKISIYDTLICPNCIERNNETKLLQKDSEFLCGSCRSVFPIIDDILFLFSNDKFEKLYPDILKKI